jgi:hypothetical protein
MKPLDRAAVATFAIALFAVPALAAEVQPAPASGATAATPANTAAPAATTAQAKPKVKVKRICSDDPVVGTRMAKRICKDVEVIDEEHVYSKEARQRMMEGGALPPPPAF